MHKQRSYQPKIQHKTNNSIKAKYGDKSVKTNHTKAEIQTIVNLLTHEIRNKTKGLSKILPNEPKTPARNNQQQEVHTVEPRAVAGMDKDGEGKRRQSNAQQRYRISKRSKARLRHGQAHNEDKLSLNNRAVGTHREEDAAAQICKEGSV
jgi:hypothetical protein